jgi:hypothetical protein
MAAVISIFILRCCLIFSYQSDLEGIEEFQVILVQTTLNSGSPYTSLHDAPCLGVPYTPLFYHLNAGIIRSLGLSDSIEPIGIYRVGRTLNLLLNLITVFVVFLIGRTLKLSVTRSLILGSIYFVFLTFHHFAIRPDSLRILLSALSVLFLLKAVTSAKTTKPFAIAGLFAALAAFAKLDSLQILAAAGLYFLFVDRRLLLQFIAVTGISFSLSMVALGALFLNIENLMSLSLGLTTGIDIQYFLIFIGIGFLTPFSLWIIRSLRISWNSLKDQDSKPELKFLATLAVVTFSISLLFSTRMGSMAVYFQDFVLVAITLLVYAWSTFGNRFWKGTAAVFIGLKLASVATLTVKAFDHTHKSEYYISKQHAQVLTNLLPSGEYAFCYQPRVNIFLRDRLSAPNMGYEYFKYLFYTNDFKIKVLDYPESNQCVAPSLVSAPMETVSETDYFSRAPRNFTPIDTSLGQVIFSYSNHTEAE